MDEMSSFASEDKCRVSEDLMAARPEVTGRGVPRMGFTIEEFSRAHGFSRATYYNMKKRKQGPDEMWVCGKIIITTEAAARWRKRGVQSAKDNPPRKQPGYRKGQFKSTKLIAADATSKLFT